jgi:hypothetical protein
MTEEKQEALEPETLSLNAIHTCEGIGFSNKIIVTPEAWIEKNNRLSLLMDIKERREAEQSKTEEIVDMYPKKDNRGTCEACGETNLQLKPSNGKRLCGKCTTIYSNARNWLSVVEQALADIYPEKYGEPSVAALGEALKIEVDSKVDAVMKRIAVAVGYSGDDPDKLADQVEIEKRRGNDLEKNYEELSLAYDNYRDSLRAPLGIENHDTDIVQAIGEMTQTLDRYKKRCEALILENSVLANQHAELTNKLAIAEQGNRWDAVPEISAPIEPAQNINKHLLDLAAVFLKNPNAGCDEVADWIEGVREAA